MKKQDNLLAAGGERKYFFTLLAWMGSEPLCRVPKGQGILGSGKGSEPSWAEPSWGSEHLGGRVEEKGIAAL